jgi:hypothetical protein
MDKTRFLITRGLKEFYTKIHIKSYKKSKKILLCEKRISPYKSGFKDLHEDLHKIIQKL